MDDTNVLEEAGAFSIHLELVPDLLCNLVTERVQNCFIFSLGSGLHAHGQLLIYDDAFGLYLRFNPRMAKVFADVGMIIQDGFQQYVQEVTESRFPEAENWFGMPDRSTMN